MADPEECFTRQPIGRFDWERVLRRIHVSAPSVKLVGLAMATYASADGSNVRPGQKRLAAVTCTSESTVRRGQSELLGIGMLEMVNKGRSYGRGHVAAFASEFRLTVPSDLIERVPMLDPDENQQSPMTGRSENYQSPMSAAYEELPVISEELPVTSEELPVKSKELPVTHDCPPDHLPNQRPLQKDQSRHVTLSDACANKHPADLEAERAKQLIELQNLIDSQKEAS